MPVTANHFKNISDLIQYLNDLEEKVNVLEQQNSALRTSIDEINTRNREMVEFLKESWPKTSLFHRSFWVRALTVFGHNLVIQLIIGVVLFILYMLLLAPVIAQLIQQATLPVP